MELYPIFDRVNRRRVMVNAERYEQERAALGRLLRYLAKTIPADAKEVLEAYPFGEVKDMYAEVTEALTTSGQRYARGELAAADSGRERLPSSPGSRPRPTTCSSRRACGPTSASASASP